MLPQSSKIVDFPVQGNADFPIFADHGLFRRRIRVDDAQTPHADAGRAETPKPHIVGPAMRHRITHPRNALLYRGRREFGRGDSTNSAHFLHQAIFLPLNKTHIAYLTARNLELDENRCFPEFRELPYDCNSTNFL